MQRSMSKIQALENLAYESSRKIIFLNKIHQLKKIVRGIGFKEKLLTAEGMLKGKGFGVKR